MEGMAIEVFALLRDVDPQAALTANGTGALNGKTDDVGRVSRRRKVNVAARNIRMTSIVQGKRVHHLGRWLIDGSHDDL